MYYGQFEVNYYLRKNFGQYKGDSTQTHQLWENEAYSWIRLSHTYSKLLPKQYAESWISFSTVEVHEL